MDKESVWDAVLIPLSGRSPGGGHGNPLQYSCLGNPMDWAWWATGHRVTKSWTWLKRVTEQAFLSSSTWGKIPLPTCGQHKPLPRYSTWKGLVTEFYLRASGLGNTTTGSTVFSWKQLYQWLTDSFLCHNNRFKIESEREPRWRRLIRKKKGVSEGISQFGQSSDDCRQIY